MSFKSIVSAEVLIRIRYKLNDDTEVPAGFQITLGGPGDDDHISYALNCKVNPAQLQQIYNILQKEET